MQVTANLREVKMLAMPQIDDQRDGFKGAILGLPLADVLQLKQQNRFSGCVTVCNADRTGKLFFRSGAVVHAEMADCEGEDACYRMLSWRKGRFEVDAKVNTTRHTVDKPLSFLLLEACRRMDEASVAGDQPAAKEPPPGFVDDYIGSLLGAFRSVPEVSGVAVTNRKGQLQNSEAPADARLATDGELLSLLGRRLGQLFDLGELQRATFRSHRQRVISLRNRSLALHLAFGAAASSEAAFAIVRTTLKSLKKA